jgi:hypothetical protein
VILGAWAAIWAARGGLFNSACKIAAEVRTLACVKSFPVCYAYSSGSGMHNRTMQPLFNRLFGAAGDSGCVGGYLGGPWMTLVKSC